MLCRSVSKFIVDNILRRAKWRAFILGRKPDMQRQWILIGLMVLLVVWVTFVSFRRLFRQLNIMFAPPPAPSVQELVAAKTPCVLPQSIADDQLSFDQQHEVCQQAISQLHSWMHAVNNRDEIQLYGEALKRLLSNRIAQQIAKGQRERFEQPCVHGAVVTKYDPMMQTIEIYAAAQSVHYVACGGSLCAGREDLPEQMLWRMSGHWQSGQMVEFEKIEQEDI